MAQTGYTPILIYSSSTTTNAPAAGNLTNSTLGSELAINITDGKLFYKDNANAIQVIAWKTTPTTAGGTGLTSYTAGDLLYYATGTTLAKLAIGASTTVLTSSGSAPQWTAQSSLAVGTASNLKSNATTGVMQIVGPTAASTRVMTIPDANFLVARLDGAQTFTAAQTIEGTTQIFTVGSSAKKLYFYPDTSGEAITTKTLQNGAGIYFNDTLDSVHLLTGGAYRLSANTAGNVTVDTGNLIIGTSGKGINFTANTPQAGMTSQLLNWYEEGTWTPSASSTVGSITTYASGGTYTRVGRQVTVTAYVDLTNVGTAAGSMLISNFPFKNGGASGAGYLQQMGVARETGVTGATYAVLLVGNSTNGYISSLTGGAITWVSTYQYALSITYYTS